MSVSSAKCLLWDFGDTLCDERFIWSSGPEWMAVYETFDDGGIGSQWSLGELSTAEFSSALTAHIPLSAAEIDAHMRACCNNIRFYQKTFEYFLNNPWPQAIVTVNPDLFSQVIVPLWKLDEACDVIVTSWEEGTEDKNILCRLALERMDMDEDNAAGLLIDNKATNVDRWISVGGAGYVYTDDASFDRYQENTLQALRR